MREFPGLTLKFADLAKMSDAEREAALDRVCSAAMQARTPEVTAWLAERVQEFEDRNGFSSEEMLARLKSGEIEETEEHASWMFWMGTRDNWKGSMRDGDDPIT